jgi:hypothetical protein
MKTKQASGAGQKREADEPLAPPTLGLVAEAERFEPLRTLIESVAATPVNELGDDLRAVLRKNANEAGLEVLVAAFFDACTARAGGIERKRAHVATANEAQGVFVLCGFRGGATTKRIQWITLLTNSSFRVLFFVTVQGGAQAVRLDQGMQRLGCQHAG